MTFTETAEPTVEAPPGETTSESWQATAAAIVSDDPTALSQRMAELNGDTQSAPTPNIEPHEIVRRIGMPVLPNDRGQHVCPVCNVPFEHAQALGPHFRLHWQEAGVKLADIPSVTSGRVRCPECEAPLIRHSLSGHLKIKHKLDGPTANGIARVYGFDLDTYLNPPPAPAPAVREPKPAKRKVNYEERQQQFVVCPFGECGAVHRRKYMKRHIQAIHNMSSDEAIATTRALPASRHQKAIQSKLPIFGRKKQPLNADKLAVIQQIDEVAPDTVAPDASTPPPFEVPTGFDFTAISPTDIAIGVVQSQVNGTMPSGLLPDVIGYVDHTRDIIDKLRSTRT